MVAIHSVVARNGCTTLSACHAYVSVVRNGCLLVIHMSVWWLGMDVCLLFICQCGGIGMDVCCYGS